MTIGFYPEARRQVLEVEGVVGEVVRARVAAAQAVETLRAASALEQALEQFRPSANCSKPL